MDGENDRTTGANDRSTAATGVTERAVSADGTVDAGDPGVADVAGEAGGADERWRQVQPALLRMRRLLLVAWLAPVALVAAVLPPLLGAPALALLALPPLACLAGCWWAMARNWHSWRYLERDDDLLISRGVLWRQLTVVPYGRMQLVEVTSGPMERRFGLSRLQLHTAAAATDAAIPGLAPAEAERLRDRLTELGEARSAGL